jgi:Holliday junction resolvase RusA-like endonuclease
MSGVTEFTWYGQVPSLKNGRIPVGKTTIPSKEYQEWLPEAQKVAKAAHKGDPWKGHVGLEVHTYGLMNDLDGAVQSITEMLQGVVYKNDRQVVAHGNNGKHKWSREDRHCDVKVWEVQDD